MKAMKFKIINCGFDFKIHSNTFFLFMAVILQEVLHQKTAITLLYKTLPSKYDVTTVCQTSRRSSSCRSSKFRGIEHWHIFYSMYLCKYMYVCTLICFIISFKFQKEPHHQKIKRLAVLHNNIYIFIYFSIYIFIISISWIS